MWSKTSRTFAIRNISFLLSSRHWDASGSIWKYLKEHGSKIALQIGIMVRLISKTLRAIIDSFSSEHLLRAKMFVPFDAAIALHRLRFTDDGISGCSSYNKTRRTLIRTPWTHVKRTHRISSRSRVASSIRRERTRASSRDTWKTRFAALNAFPRFVPKATGIVCYIEGLGRSWYTSNRCGRLDGQRMTLT